MPRPVASPGLTAEDSSTLDRDRELAGNPSYRGSRVPGSGVRGRGSGERETTASSLAGKEESSRKEDNSGQGKDGPAGAIAQGGMDGDVDFLREALRVLVEGIMDAEVSSRIGAEYGERSPERVTQRNGYRSRAWDTRVGTMDLHIPKLREGSYFPSLLEPRRRSERALLAVICDPAGLRGRCIHKAGGRSGQSPGV